MNNDAMEYAWRIMKAKEDAPNYRCPADDSKESCGTCRHWVAKEKGMGKCKLFDFDCNGKCTCDAWG